MKSLRYRNFAGNRLRYRNSPHKLHTVKIITLQFRRCPPNRMQTAAMTRCKHPSPARRTGSLTTLQIAPFTYNIIHISRERESRSVFPRSAAPPSCERDNDALIRLEVRSVRQETLRPMLFTLNSSPIPTGSPITWGHRRRG